MLHILPASLQQQLSSKCPSKTFCQIKARLRHRKGSKVRKRGGRLEWRPEELLQLANKVTTEAEIIGNVHILQAAGASSSYAERIQRPVQNWALNCFMGSSRRKITQKAKQVKKKLAVTARYCHPVPPLSAPISLPFPYPFPFRAHSSGRWQLSARSISGGSNQCNCYCFSLFHCLSSLYNFLLLL